MFVSLLKSRFKKFGDRYGYDTSYMREMADIDAAGAFKLALVSSFTSHRFSLPAAPYFAARLIATRSADCGSCLKLVIGMAREAGVSLHTIDALLRGGANLPYDMALAGRYAQAVLDNDAALLDLIPACEERWGKEGVAGLAAAVVSGAFYPTLKRGLGHGNTCQPVLAWLKEETRRDMETVNG